MIQRLDPDRLLWIGRQVLFGLGAAIAVFYWWQLNQTGNSVDAHAYWIADPNNLYPHPELLEKNGYEYSPAFELVIGWGRLLPFAIFASIWRGILLLTLVWLAGPLTLFVIFVPAVASEINAGNIQILMAAAIVLGFRWPGTWAFVILTKVSPGIGLGWFLLRRQWRQLGIALGVTFAIALVTFVIWPGRWFDYAKLLTAGTPGPVWPYYWAFWPRVAVAAGFVLLGAWRSWRWPVVVAAMFALPQFYTISPSLLVGVLPFLRSATGRWLDRRRQAPERLREQANPASSAILAG